MLSGISRTLPTSCKSSSNLGSDSGEAAASYPSAACSFLVVMVRKITECGNRLGYWSKDKGDRAQRRFHPLTNFSLKLVRYVSTPKHHEDKSGFLVEVTQRREKADGEMEIVSG